MRIDFDKISHSFGKNRVLHQISLEIPSGSILGLLGENGAGKSTLMNLLGGLLRVQEGRILLDGAPVVLRSPANSIAHGIAFIHQELNPINDLCVYENIFLGNELHNRLGILRRDAMRKEAETLLASLGMTFSADTMMRELDAGHKQIVEIARALHNNARVLIMDEPTTSLTEQEVSCLFQVVRALSEKGVSIIFISHKLNEVKELCHNYAVLRNGTLVEQGKMAEKEVADLSEAIVGHELSHWQKAKNTAQSQEILRAEGLSHLPDFQDIHFTVHKGEILGFTGLLGDGRSEIFRCVFGDIPRHDGKLFLNGKPYHARKTADAIRNGIAYVPSNRKENAIVPDLSILTNGTLATLRKHRRFGLLQRKSQLEEFLQKAGEFHTKYADVEDLITSLSGGNQQKVVLTRWLNTHPQLLILDNPTQGVDIGARQEIYDIIQDIAAAGVAVVVLSGDGQEITRLCQRAVVLYHGRLAGELSGDNLNEQNIMALATGAIKTTS